MLGVILIGIPVCFSIVFSTIVIIIYSFKFYECIKYKFSVSEIFENVKMIVFSLTLLVLSILAFNMKY